MRRGVGAFASLVVVDVTVGVDLAGRYSVIPESSLGVRLLDTPAPRLRSRTTRTPGTSVSRMIPAGSTIARLEAAADLGTGVRFVGSSVMGPDGPVHVGWNQIHDEARVVGAALQARGLVPGDHVAILGPTAAS